VENQQENIRISELIAREKLGIILPQEFEELTAWKDRSTSNAELYRKVSDDIRTRDFSAEEDLFDKGRGWNSFSRRAGLPKPAPVLYLRILRYAAMFLLPLLAAAMIYYLVVQHPAPGADTAQSYIMAGEAKAVLIMSDGDTLDLTSEAAGTLNEGDGTVITREGNMLRYESDAGMDAGSILQNSISVPRGGEYAVLLSDGTRVHLNSMTTLRYPVHFSGDSRVVDLSGEAWFDVSADKTRPFIVRSEGVEIEVLGTSFNINAYSGVPTFFITLMEGSLRVSEGGKDDESIVLRPDQQAEYSVTSGEFNIRVVDASLFSAWKDGYFIFRDQRLEDIVKTLSRWYSMEVVYQSPELKNIRFSGQLFRYNRVEQILEIFAATERIRYDIDSLTIKFY
jgi:ferric-dicitrate binding protein FerR (iron transport regulator)